MPFQIVRNDITKVEADAIVNTANPMPIVGGGTDSAIYKAAGEAKLLAERQKIGTIARGEVAVTPAFDLNAKYIIHTVGPVWEDGSKGEFDILKSCYCKSLDKAAELGCESVAFPLIATGVYGFPKDKALQIAMNAISSFLMRDDVDMNVMLVVFDDKAFRLSRNLFFQVEAFIDDEDVREAHKEEYGISQGELNRARRYNEVLEPDGGKVGNKPKRQPTIVPIEKPFDEHSFDKNLYMNDGKVNLTFQKHLLKLIIDRDLDNKIVYKRSNVNKGVFSKIMCGDTKIPKKSTILGFCIGLKLSMEEAQELLASADMGFNPYDKRDQLVIKCIQRGQYDMEAINAMLYICKQPLLGN